MQKFGLICVIGVIFLFNFVRSEPYQKENCTRRNELRALGTIRGLDISPCSKFTEGGQSCEFTRGVTVATIKFNVTHSKNARRLKNTMAWTTTAADLPFTALRANACKNTKCPIKENVEQPYSANVPITRNLPTGSYPVKFMLKDGSKVVTCFIFQIKIV